MDATTPLEPPPPPRPVVDNVGIFWITLTCVYTSFLLAGIIYLWMNRSHPTIRIRKPVLTIAAVLNLHIYWVLCSLGYVLGPVFPEMLEFWIMSIYFPIGLALFQTANTSLLSVSRGQERCFVGKAPGPSARRGQSHNGQPGSRPSWPTMLRERWASVCEATKMGWYITFAVLLQVLLAVFIFCISRKFHPGWGIPGTEVPGEPALRKLAIGRGWEWIPSIGWQVFWTWIWAPYVLYKTRHIKDTHGWRLQTMVCCISGLPAAPLWLIALYVPAMGAVNKYWIPPNWICLSLTVMEIFSIFVPCYMVAFRSKALQSETLAAIKVWEASKLGKSSFSAASGSGSETTDTSYGFVNFNGLMTESETHLNGAKEATDQPRKSLFGIPLPRPAPASPLPSSGGNAAVIFPPNPAVNPGAIKKLPAALFSRDALEHCLRLNPEPLQQFAALKDFSGENIAFLTSVRQWKTSYASQGHSRGHSGSTLAAAGHPSSDQSTSRSMAITKQTSFTITPLPNNASFSRPFHRSSVIATDTNDAPAHTQPSPNENISHPTPSPLRRNPTTSQRNPPRDSAPDRHNTNPLQPRQRRHLFNLALRIYASSISYDHATFPVNLASRDRKHLESIFGDAARTLFGRRRGGLRRGSAGTAGSGGSGQSEMTLWNAWDDGLEKNGSVSAGAGGDDGDDMQAQGEIDGPFGPILRAEPAVTETPVPSQPGCAYCGTKHSSLLPVLHPVNDVAAATAGAGRRAICGEDEDDLISGPEEILKGRGVWYYGEIPEGFGAGAFDRAEESVFGMVLMDTWPKFVRSGGGRGGLGV